MLLLYQARQHLNFQMHEIGKSFQCIKLRGAELTEMQANIVCSRETNSTPLLKKLSHIT